MVSEGQGLSIRRAVEADVSEIVLLERETGTAPHWAVAEYVGMLGRPDGGVQRVLFVAAEGPSARTIVGFAAGKAVRVGREMEAELESVVVRPELRKQGVGSSLCRAVMEWCRDLGAGSITLEVRAGSQGAIRLYGGLGFVAAGRRPGYYSEPAEDAVVMRCALGRRRPAAVEAAAEPAQMSGWLDV